MVEILGAEIPVPSFSGGFSSTALIIVGSIFIICLCVAVGFWFWYQKKLYNKKIVVFENISGQGFQPIFKDTARLISIGDGGEEIMFLRKKKVYRTAYGRKMGTNTYWFVIGQDGYWYNSVLGDLDAKMGMLDIEPIDRDMRYMHVAVRRNITERYRKVNFMEKYGTMVMSAVFLLIMILGIWFLLDQMSENASVINEGIQTTKQVMEMNKNVIASLDNICTGGSGMTPVTIT